MPDIDISLLDDMISGHFDYAKLVFCHGDIRSGNIILSENSPGKIGIIDFGNACYNARESDFAAIWQSQLRGEVAEAYEKHSGHVLDAKLIEKFSTLHGALRLGRARKRVNDRQGPRL